MAEITASVLIGQPHSHSGGILPTHQLLLSENSKPALILFKLNGRPPKDKKTIWIPTVENLLEDMLLMISIYVLQNPSLHQGFLNSLPSPNEEPIALYALGAQTLDGFYQKNRDYLHKNHSFKIAVTAYAGSTLNRQLAKLKKYKMDMEICKTCFEKFYSLWEEKTVTRGKLE